MPYSGYTVGGDEVLVSGQPDSNQAILGSLLTSLGVDIAGLQIHDGLNGGDVGVDIEVVTLIGVHLSENISGLVLGQSQLDLNIGAGGLDRIIELILLLIDIDLLAIRGNKETVL